MPVTRNKISQLTGSNESWAECEMERSAECHWGSLGYIFQNNFLFFRPVKRPA